jgi:hypothetical protein
MKMKRSRAALLIVPLIAVPALAASAREAPEPRAKQQQQAKEQPQPKQRQAPNKGITPEADRMLRRMTNYLAGLQSFKVKNAAVDEVVMKSGQKLQSVTESEVSVVRPNKLRSRQLGEAGQMDFMYDGKVMSLYCRADNTYATVPAPPTLDAAIDMMRKDHEIEAPGADLMVSRPYEALTEQVTGGQVIGRETIGGVVANHLAFQGESVDWQVWIKDGAEPVPMRYVITTKTVKNAPQFTAQFSSWESGAKLADSDFVLTPPPGAKRVDKLPTSCGAPQQTK